MTFQQFLQSVPHENFVSLCLDIAHREENWGRVETRCGAELVEEFNNDAIEELEVDWARKHGVDDTSDEEEEEEEDQEDD